MYYTYVTTLPLECANTQVDGASDLQANVEVVDEVVSSSRHK